LNRACNSSEQFQFHPTIPPLDLGLFAEVAPEEIWFRMKPLQVPANCYRLGEIRTVVEFQHRYRTRRVLCEEFRRAACPAKISILQARYEILLPSITSTYLAVLSLLYAGLSLQVVRLRRKYRVAFGDKGNATLRSSIRAHSHFAEYVPVITLMVAMLEIAGSPAARLHMLMGALLLARLLHPIGMYAAPQTTQFQVGRVGGMVITMRTTSKPSGPAGWLCC